ncbi:hypothetical protein RB195_022048 [Necator americanus]|uniref:Reverse transcriptase domain-containing protein n=1 Tax=Necator americanus TaxID=51031 RepID=A0ABR1EDR2_NECAM
MAEATKTGKSIRYARQDFTNCEAKMTALRSRKTTTSASIKGMKKIICDFFSDLFVLRSMSTCLLTIRGKMDMPFPEVLPSEVRHAIMSVRNRTSPGPDRIRPEHVKNLPPVLINTPARLFTR